MNTVGITWNVQEVIATSQWYEEEGMVKMVWFTYKPIFEKPETSGYPT